MSSVGDLAQGLGRVARNQARQAVIPLILGLACLLAGAAGLGFLTVWAYLVLSVALGPETACLLIGLGFLSLAGALLLFARRQPSKRDAPDPPAAQAEVPASDPPDAASLVAFTAAFVLARAIADKNG
ncbi:hypothetical protein M8756_04655 [Lutimaribacter sp. EGI FJ00015]|uniref:Uncharacterized protein n=1 Tax=Lutimaribacter degradans TaxID=2945989 RepID=A0ACC5ZVX0_9RHOB|nr:hypothetical protein [Lutimaribacter sp. EGI FJ00013]MCM2561699.1 hypothetical protein [Lutimaribacter sp. EGI FJ00013]MCO0612588.1 hypothetical protein [Lutimaribacter sp. EGI FJ00015]MCO0635247.1 hypothetical protein [Lutimaribacter sp. EGI FJ00014]